MNIIAIDPGYKETGYVIYDGSSVLDHAVQPNETLLLKFTSDPWVGQGFQPPDVIVFEKLESFGMPVGREVLETIWWTGRMHQAALHMCRRVERMTRKEVKSHLCGSTRATDGSIRLALTDRFGGTKADAFGVKSKRGPLYGVKSHELAALAVAVTWYDQHVNDGEEIRPGVAAQF